MANEGSTKPTYSNEELMANCQRERRLLGDKYDELESELARVRGLLQRYGKHDEGCTWSKGLCSQLECYEMHETACTCGLAQGAESADIGKLDTADKSGKVNRVEERDAE